MKKYINTSNYYLSTTTSKIEENTLTWSFDVADVTIDWVTLPLQWYYWVDVDFGDASKREIFRIVSRSWYNLTYDMRISPNGRHTHQSGASVWLRDFSQLLNSLSTNTDNFWEVEQTWDLTIKVRWGILYNPSNTNAETGKITISDTDFTLLVNATTYIVVEHDEILWYQFAAKSSLLLEETWQYPIAKIVTWLNSISDDGIIDLRATIIWQWNMRSEVYDPDKKELDVYNYENFYNIPVAEDWDISDISDREGKRQYWDAKQEELIWEWWIGSWQNIKTIAWQNILWNWDISLDTILTVGWAFEDIPPETTERQFQNIPLSNDAFIIMNNSGQVLVEWEEWDYTYDSDAHTVIFPAWMPTSEEYRAWIMYDNSEWWTMHIWSWIITITCWEEEQWWQIVPKIWEFNVNQDGPCDIDLTTQITGMINKTLWEVETLLEQI